MAMDKVSRGDYIFVKAYALSGRTGIFKVQDVRRGSVLLKSRQRVVFNGGCKKCIRSDKKCAWRGKHRGKRGYICVKEYLILHDPEVQKVSKLTGLLKG